MNAEGLDHACNNYGCTLLIHGWRFMDALVAVQAFRLYLIDQRTVEQAHSLTMARFDTPDRIKITPDARLEFLAQYALGVRTQLFGESLEADLQMVEIP